MTSRADIVTEARKLLGTPFHHQGYSVAGMDCIGVIGYLGLKFGFEGAAEWKADPRFHSYSPQPDLRLQVEGCSRFLVEIKPKEATLADILWLRWESDPMHFALVSRLAPTKVIHALARVGSVVEAGPPSGAHMARRAYRFRGIE